MYEDLLLDACLELKEAVDEMLSPTSPETALPSLKSFCLLKGKTDGVFWPLLTNLGETVFRRVSSKKENTKTGYPNKDWEESIGSSKVPERILILAEGQPKRILFAIRQLEAATVWCKKRMEGRQLDSREILRQQNKAVKDLTVRLAERGLGG